VTSIEMHIYQTMSKEETKQSVPQIDGWASF
jgi:hypothetical protein